MGGGIYRLQTAGRLWRGLHIQRAFSLSPSVTIASRFWRSKPLDSNSSKEDIPAKIQHLIRKRRPFIDPVSVYMTLKKIEGKIVEEENGFEAFESVQEAINLSNNAQLSTGSYVEFYDPLTNKANIGVVVAGATTRFTTQLNVARVLTINGDLVDVDGPQVTFHLYRLWNDEELNINDHTRVLRALNCFVRDVVEKSDDMDEELNKLFLQVGLPHSIKGIQLEQIYNLMVQNEFTSPPETYLQQGSLLLSIHLGLCRSPNWIVSSLYLQMKMSNLTFNQSSNLLAFNSAYYVNSIKNVDYITKFLNEFAKRKSDFNNHITYMIANGAVGKNYENIMHYYNIWEGKEFRHLIETLKFALVYPHPEITTRLCKMDVFKTIGGATPLNIYNILCQLRIYDNQANQLTDPFLSANMLGDIQLSNLAASTLSEINHSEIRRQVEDKVSIISDKFPHLRNVIPPKKDGKIYAIPLSNPIGEISKQSYICVSLPRDSSEQGLDFYIPDIAAKVSPSTLKFESIWTGRFPASSITNLPNNQEFWMVEPKIASKLAFSGNPKNESTLAGFIPLETKLKQEFTSFTVSFRTRSKFEPLFKDLSKKVAISLQSIPSSNIHVLDWLMLQALLEKGKSSHRREEIFAQNPDITEDDEKQIKLIYEVLYNHFIHRVKSAASPILTMDYDTSECNGSRISVQGRINSKQIVETEIKETSIPPKSEMSESMIFVDEVDKMLGHMISEYCFEHHIPILRESQYLYLTLTEMITGDEAVVSHDNKYFPAFEAGSYYHTLIVKNPEWSLSASAFLIGRHFLLKPTTRVSTAVSEQEDDEDAVSHLPLGMKHGYAKIADPLQDFSSWINQLQLVQHLQRQYTETWTNISRFNYLIKLGYSLKGALNEFQLQPAMEAVVNFHLVAQYASSWMKRFWTLKRLEQDICKKKSPLKFHCVVTQVGPVIDNIKSNPRLCLAFCKQLDLEIELLTDEKVKIGTQVTAKKVGYVNAIEGDCVLQL